MTVENAIMRLSDRIMEQEELTKLIEKEIKYEILDSAKNSVITNVGYLTKEIETQRNFKRI